MVLSEISCEFGVWLGLAFDMFDGVEIEYGISLMDIFLALSFLEIIVWFITRINGSTRNEDILQVKKKRGD